MWAFLLPARMLAHLSYFTVNGIFSSFLFVFVFIFSFRQVQLEGIEDVCGPFYSVPGSWLICLILLLNSLFSADGTFSNFLYTISRQKHLVPDFLCMR